MLELEEQLLKYKKYVLLDNDNYLRMLNGTALKKSEQKIIQFLVAQHEQTDYRRLISILDLVMKYNVHLEFEVTKNSTERLKNEHHIQVEQREMELR